MSYFFAMMFAKVAGTFFVLIVSVLLIEKAIKESSPEGSIKDHKKTPTWLAVFGAISVGICFLSTVLALICGIWGL